MSHGWARSVISRSLSWTFFFRSESELRAEAETKAASSDIHHDGVRICKRGRVLVTVLWLTVVHLGLIRVRFGIRSGYLRLSFSVVAPKLCSSFDLRIHLLALVGKYLQ
jgi:hypothetical protein